MRKSKFIPMLLIPAAFVACTNEDVLDNYAANELSKNIVKDVVFNVSLDADVVSRGAYAGATEGTTFMPFEHFYLEPSFADEQNATTPSLTNNNSFSGDMMGFCLTNGASAVTNMPFYVAGYGSAKATTPADAQTTIYPFALHELDLDDNVWGSSNALYTLNLDNKLYTAAAVFNQGQFKESVAAIKAKKVKEDLAAGALDVRKAIVRNNAGVMTGDYIAYYPYNANFTEPGGVPVVALEDLYVLGATPTANDRIAALEAYPDKTSFKKNLFAISRQTNHVNGATKSGDVSVVPMTALNIFRLVNTAKTLGGTYKNQDISVKRIIVTAAENSADTDFVLEGSVALNNLNEIVATKTSSFVGVQFPAINVTNGYDPENPASPQTYVSLPFYPVSGKQIKIEVYSTNGKVASVVKNTIPTLGNAYTWTVDLGELDFVPVTRKVFTEDDFKAEKDTEGNLLLMRDILVDDVITIDADLNIEGTKTLTLSNATINGDLTFAEGTTVELTGATALTGNAVLSADKAIFNYTSETTIANHIEVEELTIPVGSSVILKDAEVATVINNGTLRVANAAQKTVEFTTLNNNKSFLLGTTHAATVGTLNNNAGASFNLAGEITATVINNAAGIPATKTTPAVPAASITVHNLADTDILGETTINNAGTISWDSAAELDMTVNNSGDFTVSRKCDFSGEFVNTGNFYVTINGNVEGVAGSVTNSTNGYINVIGYFGFTTTKLNINAGVVEDNGTINGNTNITVAEGAEFIGNAGDDNTLISALSSFNINGKYTGINVTGDVAWPTNVASTDKKIYQKGDITFGAATALNGGLEVCESSTVTATKGLTISEVAIKADKTMTIAANSNITVTGIITNNGYYVQDASAVVWCNGIAGSGNWGSLKPRY